MPRRSIPDPPPKPDVKTREDWVVLVEAFEASGQKLATFARERGVKRAELWSWRKRLQAPEAPEASPEVAGGPEVSTSISEPSRPPVAPRAAVGEPQPLQSLAWRDFWPPLVYELRRTQPGLTHHDAMREAAEAWKLRPVYPGLEPTADAWAALVRQWQRSSLPSAAFARQQRTDPACLVWWHAHLQRADAREAACAAEPTPTPKKARSRARPKSHTTKRAPEPELHHATQRRNEDFVALIDHMALGAREGGWTTRELMKALGRSKKTLLLLLNEAEDLGVVYRTGIKRGTRWFLG